MVTKKFYDTPEGKLKTEQLLRSGVIYHKDSVENRLLHINFAIESAFRYNVTYWVLTKLLDLLNFIAVGKLKDDFREDYIKRNYEVRDNITDLINPFKKIQRELEEHEKKVQRNVDEDRKKVLEVLGSRGGYGSLEELAGAIKALQEVTHNENWKGGHVTRIKN